MCILAQKPLRTTHLIPMWEEINLQRVPMFSCMCGVFLPLILSPLQASICMIAANGPALCRGGPGY